LDLEVRNKAKIYSPASENWKTILTRRRGETEDGRDSVEKFKFRAINAVQYADGAFKMPDHKLSTVATHIGHKFRHHNALDDAEAAGRVLAAIIKEHGEAWVVG
jgi:DNA polymerase III epsilon subunit-like protein